MTDPKTFPVTLDDMERMAQAAVDQDDGEGAANDALPHGFPPLLVLGLIQRVRAAESILRDLAKMPARRIQDGTGHCFFCGAVDRDGESDSEPPHDANCIRRRAVEATK